MTASLRQNGFTLLEALVALVVISIGLLGLLGLQTVAIVNTHVSKSQTLASIGADDIADRIRANPAATASLVYAQISDSGTAQPQADCTQATCSPTEMASYDAWEWQQTLASTLPDGRGDVSCAAPTNPTSDNPCRVYDVTVLWRGQDAAAGSGSGDVSACPSAGSGNGNGNGNSGSSNSANSSGSAGVRCYAIEVHP
ncbi:type IV pilus modification protein PilV [Salinisphaera hydrothermalis]|uniref:type IV pilus modification protein PilV n=1 Tax=Salinisphaera hydrothermalis TaxID=563188 RepID=UPI00334146CE